MSPQKLSPEGSAACGESLDRNTFFGDPFELAYGEQVHYQLQNLVSLVRRVLLVLPLMDVHRAQRDVGMPSVVVVVVVASAFSVWLFLDTPCGPRNSDPIPASHAVVLLAFSTTGYTSLGVAAQMLDT